MRTFTDSLPDTLCAAITHGSSYQPFYQYLVGLKASTTDDLQIAANTIATLGFVPQKTSPRGDPHQAWLFSPAGLAMLAIIRPSLTTEQIWRMDSRQSRAALDELGTKKLKSYLEDIAKAEHWTHLPGIDGDLEFHGNLSRLFDRSHRVKSLAHDTMVQIGAKAHRNQLVTPRWIESSDLCQLSSSYLDHGDITHPILDAFIVLTGALQLAIYLDERSPSRLHAPLANRLKTIWKRILFGSHSSHFRRIYIDHLDGSEISHFWRDWLIAETRTAEDPQFTWIDHFFPQNQTITIGLQDWCQRTSDQLMQIYKIGAAVEQSWKAAIAPSATRQWIRNLVAELNHHDLDEEVLKELNQNLGSIRNEEWSQVSFLQSNPPPVHLTESERTLWNHTRDKEYKSAIASKKGDLESLSQAVKKAELIRQLILELRSAFPDHTPEIGLGQVNQRIFEFNALSIANEELFRILIDKEFPDEITE